MHVISDDQQSLTPIWEREKMARSTVFGYTVETEDGKLVITLTGSLAESLAEKYSTESIGQNPRLLASLLPFGDLGSRSVLLRPSGPSREKQASNHIDLKEIFGQGFDRSQNEFEAQLEEYRGLLDPREPGDKQNRTANAEAPRNARKSSARKRRR